MDSTGPGTSIRILLVEDDADQAQLLSRWLASAGRYQVAHAASGAEGEAMLRCREWDLVVSDIELPGMSGLDLLRITKETQRYTPTLLITAHGSLDYALEAIRGGAGDFLLKPFARRPFLDKVSDLAARGTAERRMHCHIVLAIGAHPDDVEIGCGGTLLRCTSRGDRVAVLTLSGGEQGGTASERVEEARRAAVVLGARLFVGALTDAAIPEGQETISLIEDTIRTVQPTVVYTHSLHDGHQDHRSAHRASIVACRGIPSLYCYQAPSSSIDFRPTKFVEVSDFMGRKVEAIAAYRSQVARRPYLRETLVRATAEYWGRFAQYGFVEPLEVIRESD